MIFSFSHWCGGILAHSWRYFSSLRFVDICLCTAFLRSQSWCEVFVQVGCVWFSPNTVLAQHRCFGLDYPKGVAPWVLWFVQMPLSKPKLCCQSSTISFNMLTEACKVVDTTLVFLFVWALLLAIVLTHTCLLHTIKLLKSLVLIDKAYTLFSPWLDLLKYDNTGGIATSRSQ